MQLGNYVNTVNIPKLQLVRAEGIISKTSILIIKDIILAS